LQKIAPVFEKSVCAAVFASRRNT